MWALILSPFRTPTEDDDLELIERPAKGELARLRGAVRLFVEGQLGCAQWPSARSPQPALWCVGALRDRPEASWRFRANDLLALHRHERLTRRRLTPEQGRPFAFGYRLVDGVDYLPS